MKDKNTAAVKSKETTMDKENVKNRFARINKQLLFGLGITAGVLLFSVYRFASYDPDHTHFHANFAIYVNGEKEKFEEFGYYEELTGCSSDSSSTARGRGHMHESEDGLVHVHEEAVTWGNFFENLGYSVGRNHVSTDITTYTGTDDQQIAFILNGKAVTGNIAEKEIGDEDRLLISVGSSTEESLEFFDTVVPANAGEFNDGSDPGTCSSGESHGFTDRLKAVF